MPPAKKAAVVAGSVHVSETIGHDAVKPALHNGRWAAPPERKEEDDQICPGHSVLFAPDIGRKAIGSLGGRLFW